MTFDFAPGWLDTLSGPTDYATPAPRPAQSDIGARRALPAPCPPAHPTAAQMADLVAELFTEGSLSFEQLRSLSNVPELEPLLEDRVAGVPTARRLAHAKR